MFGLANLTKELIDAEEVIVNDPRNVVAEKLLKEGRLKDSVLISGLTKEGKSSQGGNLMVQNVVPTLRALGAIPANVPDSFPFGVENDSLVRLLRKRTATEEDGKAYLKGGSARDAVVFTTDTNIPGVDVRVAMDKDYIHDYRSLAAPNGYPLISRMELVFSPLALANMEPGPNPEHRK